MTHTLDDLRYSLRAVKLTEGDTLIREITGISKDHFQLLNELHSFGYVNRISSPKSTYSLLSSAQELLKLLNIDHVYKQLNTEKKWFRFDTVNIKNLHNDAVQIANAQEKLEKVTVGNLTLKVNNPLEGQQSNTVVPNPLHDKVLVWALKYLETHPKFTFWLRTSKKFNRLQSGYWFQGTHSYASMGLFNLRSNNKSTKAMALVFWPNKEELGVTFDVIYKEPQSENLKDFYERVRDLISLDRSFAEPLRIDNYSRFRLTLAHQKPFEAVERFLSKYLEPINNLIFEHKLDKSIIPLERFEANLQNTISYREILLENPLSLQEKSNTNDGPEDEEPKETDPELEKTYNQKNSIKNADTEIQGDSEVSFLNIDKIAALFTNTLIKSVEKPGSKQAQEDRFYGIFGRWGRGKTHFWGKIEAILRSKENKKKFIPIPFHAWKYQDTPAIWAYLYETLADRYYYSRKRTRSKAWTGVINKLQAIWLNAFRDPSQVLMSFVSLGLLVCTVLIYPWSTSLNLEDTLAKFFGLNEGLSTGSLAFGGFIITGLTAIYKFRKNPLAITAKELMRQHSKRTSFKHHLGIQHEAQEELIHLLKAWTYFSKRKVVLFVDDIDRCSHDKIIDIVDSIRVMINNEKIQTKMVVLAAIDERILFRAIRKKYDSFIEDKEQLDQLCYEYFDKLFIAGIKLGSLDKQMKKDVLKGIIKNQIGSGPINNNSSSETEFSKTDNNSNTGQPNNEKITSDTNTEGKSDSQTDNKDSPSPSSSGDKAENDIVSEPTKSKNQLSKQEAQWMENIIEALEEATPRSIRNFSIKYRMARGLIELQVDQSDATVQKAWYAEELIKSALMEIILTLMNRKEPSFESVDEELRPIFKQAVDMVTFYTLDGQKQKRENSVNSEKNAPSE